MSKSELTSVLHTLRAITGASCRSLLATRPRSALESPFATPLPAALTPSATLCEASLAVTSLPHRFYYILLRMFDFVNKFEESF